jgi:phage tail-like protein
MADDGSVQSQATWPLVRFQFQVKWDSTELVFQEVTGLNIETQVIEYRGGNSKAYAPVKMPGLKKYGNVTLKKGMFKGDTALWKQFTTVQMNTYKRSTIVISLLDETNKVAMSWNLTNAFPSKITITDMKADANEAAVESIEITHEGLTLAS